MFPKMKRKSWLHAAALIALVLVAAFAMLMGCYKRAVEKTTLNDTIDAYMQSMLRAWNIPGAAVVVVSDGQVTHLQGYGRADSSGRPVTPQTPFEIGSCSKSFTALAVMQQVEQGKIELDAPVQQYLPWFRLADRDVSARITVRNLLNHASGIPRSATNRLMVNPNNLSLEDRVRELRTQPVNHQPGTIYEYSNDNYMILALILETLSGQPYGAYLRQNVFAPLGMENSFTDTTEARQHGLSDGHTSWFGIPLETLEQPRPDMLGAGYVMTSAKDMGRYLIAQTNGGTYGTTRLLSVEGMDQMHRPGALAPKDSPYAMGWTRYQEDGVTHVQHGGQSASFTCSMYLFPERRLGLAVLANISSMQGPLAAHSMAYGLKNMLLTGKPALVDPAYRNFYLPWDGGFFAFTGLILWSLFDDTPRWRKKLSMQPPETGRAVFRRIVLPTLFDGLVFLAALLGLPLSVGRSLWRGLAVWQPDAVYWCLGAAALMLIKVVLRLWTAVQFAARAKHPARRQVWNGMH